MSMRTVLLIDDDPSIRRIAELVLSKRGGWHVTLAEGGRQAIEILKIVRFEVILCDVMMPGMDGISTLIELQKIKNFNGTPLIFMTAKVLKPEIQQYMDLGAAGVITKPFDPVTLNEELTLLLNTWQRGLSKSERAPEAVAL